MFQKYIFNVFNSIINFIKLKFRGFYIGNKKSIEMPLWKPVYNLNKSIDWWALTLNENAIPILEQNLDKINWDCLSQNKNAIHLLEQNLDKDHWRFFSYNENAIHLIKKKFR